MFSNRNQSNLRYTPDYKPVKTSNFMLAVKIIGSLIAVVILATAVTLLVLGLRGNLTRKKNEITTTRLMIPGTLPTQAQCGIQQVKPSIDGETLNSRRRIISGEKAITDSWPWSVSIRTLNGNKIGHHFCGGSLVYSKYIVTAAHCIKKRNKNEIVIIIGITEFNAPVDFSNMYYIQDLIIHPNFDEKEIKNDIAMIKLNRNVMTTQNICLPEGNFTSLFGKKTVLVGWGSTSGVNEIKDLSRILLQTVLIVRNNEKVCQASNTTYCALSYSGTSNACYGDSGGPLMYYENGRWYLFGLTSYIIASSDKCLPNFPSYYSAIPVFLDWLGSAIATMSK